MTERTWHSLPEYEALRALMESGTTSKAAVRLGLSHRRRSSLTNGSIRCLRRWTASMGNPPRCRKRSALWRRQPMRTGFWCITLRPS